MQVRSDVAQKAALTAYRRGWEYARAVSQATRLAFFLACRDDQVG